MTGQTDDIDDPDYFWSKENAAINRAQEKIEKLALEIIGAPAFGKAKDRARFMWRSVVGDRPGEKSWARFEASLDEYAYNAALKAANCDPNYPEVATSLYGPPHRWMEIDVPGSRLGGDNPDNQYTLIPVDGLANFELYGKFADLRTTDVNFTLMGNTTLSKTIASLEDHQLQVEADGRFKVTIGPAPAEGKANHLQTKHDTLFLFIRESRGDWRQRNMRIRIRRLDPPAAPKLTFEQMVERAADIMIFDVPWTFWWIALSHGRPLNQMCEPYKTVNVGGLYSQQVSFGHLIMKPDDAFIITVAAGGAGYRNIVLHDYWYVSLDFGNRLSSLNSGQAKPDEDGNFTYVISADDPGIHNWLDPVGQEEVLIVKRWQKLPEDAGATPPGISSRMVKWSELDSVLPKGVCRIGPAERELQIEERARQLSLRFADV